MEAFVVSRSRCLRRTITSQEWPRHALAVLIGAACMFAAYGAAWAQELAPTTQPAATAAAAATSAAPATTAPGPGNKTKLSLDPFAAGAGSDLMLFQDMPVVVSASRQAQPLNLSSVPVSIITAQDIHYSARTTLPEILQFVPGNQLNLTLSKALFEKHLELTAGVSDLFDATRHGTPEDGKFTTHDTPGRIFFVRLEGKW